MSRKNLKKQINQTELLNAVSRVQRNFISEKPVDDIFNDLLKLLLKITNSAYGFIGEVLYNENKKPYLKIHAISNIAWDKKTMDFYLAHAPKGMVFKNLKTLFGHVMVSELPLISNDPKNDPRAGGLPEGHPDMNTFMGLPFFSKKGLNGMVGIANRAGGYNEELANELEPLLTTCAILVEGYRSNLKRVNAENELKESNRILEIRNREQERFMYVLTHDLKTPIRGISTLIDFLEKDSFATLNKESQQFFVQIKERAQRLDSLINGVLQYSKLTMAKIEYEEVNLGSMFHEIKEALKIPKGFKLSIPDNLPIISINKNTLGRVFYNLIENAINYNHNKNGLVEIGYSDNLTTHFFSIKDNGPGIESRYHKKVFEIFQTLEQKDKNNATGIGLAIVKKIIDNEGGVIHINSSPGKGTEFIIELTKAEFRKDAA